MGALCLLPSMPPSCLGRGLACSPCALRPTATLPLPPSAYSWLQPQLATGGGRRLAGVARGSGEKGGKNGGAEFFREDGVVDDMDGYLNYLSLEYDSVWDTKPSWLICYGCGSLPQSANYSMSSSRRPPPSPITCIFRVFVMYPY